MINLKVPENDGHCIYITCIILGICAGSHNHSSLDDRNTEVKLQETLNYGHEVLVKCGVHVTQGLSRDPKTEASILHSKGFVSDELLEEITDLNVTKSCNGQKLYMAILDVVKCYPHRYTDFISVLEENAILHDNLLTILREAYCEIGQSDHSNYNIMILTWELVLV